MTESALAHWVPNDDDMPLMDITLGDMLDRQVARFHDRPAAIAIDDLRGIDVRWSYGALQQAANLTARGLIALGVQPGDHVAVMATNGPEWLRLEYALAKIGATLVTVNPALQRDEIAYLLQQGQVRWLVANPRFRRNDIAAALLSLMPDLATAPPGGRGDGAETLPLLKGVIGIGTELPPFALPFDALDCLAKECPDTTLTARQAAVQPGDVVQIQYTSGTTGKPKGAMLTHHSVVNNAALMAARGGYQPDDVLLSPMPLFHAAGCVCNVIGMLSVGGCVVITESFDPERTLDLWGKLRPTVFNGVPTMYARMLDHPTAKGRDLRLRIANTGGTSIPPVLMKRLLDEHGAQPMIIMGMTECSPIITLTDPNDPQEIQFTTSGTPLPHSEIRIVDPETGETARFGERGELCIRGYQVTKGYFDMPDKTTETIDADGWLRSGDLAVLEPTGHLRIVGRLKDMLIRGGENVYPVEIENYLLTHDAISQAQVVGAPDPDLGEEVFAFVKLRDGHTLSPDDVRAFCRAGLARHKLPKYVEIVEDFPMTGNGKIQKFALREMAARIVEASA